MIKPGDVFWVYHRDIYPQKHKMDVCVCAKRGWFFLINSEYRKMYDCVPILKVQHRFLKHDSFVSCSRVFAPEKSELGKKIGTLARGVMEEMLARVQVSETLEQGKIEVISMSLMRAIGKG